MVQNSYDLPDEVLCARCAEDRDLQEVLIRRHTGLVRACVRALYLTGGDYEDLVQEGMIGLLQAIRTYDVAQGVSFQNFAAICIRRRAISAVRAASAQKHQVLNAAVPLPCSPFGAGLPTEDVCEADPEKVVIGQEETEAFFRRLDNSLSKLEKRVLQLYLEGLSYHEIATHLDRPVKTVDNAVQRIRAKAVRNRQSSDNGG